MRPKVELALLPYSEDSPRAEEIRGGYTSSGSGVVFDVEPIAESFSQRYADYDAALGTAYVDYCLADAKIPAPQRARLRNMGRRQVQDLLDAEHPLIVRQNGYSIHVTREAGFRYALHHQYNPLKQFGDDELRTVMEEDFLDFMRGPPLSVIKTTATIKAMGDYMTIIRVGPREFKVTHLGCDPTTITEEPSSLLK